MAAAVSLAAAVPAQASCTATISVHSITITTSNIYNVKGTLTHACGAVLAS
jgi:hypothetical protein